MIAIVNIKDLLKYLVGILMAIFIVISSTRFLNEYKEKNINSKIEESIDASISSIFNYDFINCLKIAMPVVNIKESSNDSFENYGEYIFTTRSGTNVKQILGYQMSILNNIKTDNNNEEASAESTVAEMVENNNDENSDNISTYNEEIILAKTDVKTEIIDENNIKASYTDKYKTVEIKNQTDFNLTDDILTPDCEISNKKDVIIYHTHTCESYTATERFNYKMTGTFRTTDLNYSVSRVGDELEKYLAAYGFNVVHNKAKHDYPAYNGSYTRSLETIKNVLKDNSSAEIVFDLHRDAVGSKSDYAPTVKIGDEYVAQLMFVIGTSGGGASHPNWKENLKFAIKIQEKANELYPGLFRPIILREARYNQHVTKAASIVEVGATGNTLEQCLTSMKYLAKILSEI